MIGSSFQENLLEPSEPSTEVEQPVMHDSSRSSTGLDLAGEDNKDLKKYASCYEEGYNLYDP